MKISKSKKELARIISENGGWRDGEFAVQNGGHGRISFSQNKPARSDARSWMAHGGFQFKIEVCKPLPNWHQTILSRAEYFHLYPEPDAKPEFCESVILSIPEPEINSKNINITQVDDIGVVESKPTIEQLAADYRNAKDCAERKQLEADDAKADADSKLKALELAGEALDLLISPIAAKQEPELVITDWRDLQVGDKVDCVDYELKYRFGAVSDIDPLGGEQCVEVSHKNGEKSWPANWRFIRRP